MQNITNGKGDKQRPMNIPIKEFIKKWDKIFKGKKNHS